MVLPEQKLTSASPQPQPPPEQAEIDEAQAAYGAILTAVTDLDGLLTVDSLAQLLTAGPDEVVSFSDHPLFGAFHGYLEFDEILAEIKNAVDRGELVIGAYGRLMLPGS